MNKFLISEIDFDNVLLNLAKVLNEIENFKKEKSKSLDWLCAEDVCKMLKISKRTLMGYKLSNKIGFSQVGGKIYYKTSDIDEMLNSHYVPKLGKSFNN